MRFKPIVPFLVGFFSLLGRHDCSDGFRDLGSEDGDVPRTLARSSEPVDDAVTRNTELEQVER